jgi:hypothetical protein
MIWDLRAVRRALVMRVRKAQLWALGLSRPAPLALRKQFYGVAVVKERLLALMLLFALLFTVIAGRLIMVTEGYYSLPSAAAQHLTLLQILIGACLYIAALIGLTVFVQSPRLLAKFISWIVSGRRERKIAFVGLGILCVGFALQAWVNLLQ